MAIKIAGRKTATSKTSTRKSAAKPAARSTSTRRKTPAKSAGTTMSDGRVRRPVTNDERVINKHIKILERVGAEREEAKVAHDEAVEAVYKATKAAMDAGVPTGVISEYAGISRQWLYKMGEHQGRNGSDTAKSPARKPAAKASTRASAAKKSTRPTIRTRSR